MKKLLITGFDPFGGASVNPAWEAVKLLPDAICGYELNKLMIPTVFGVAADRILRHAAGFSPDVILCIGQAGGRNAVTPERIAVNIRDARIPDNAGSRPTGERIVADGPAAYFSTVPVQEMADAICAAGLPGAVSNSAGTFVCNDVMYSLLHRYAGTSTRVGFIHVPWLPEQGIPALPLAQAVRSLQAAITAL